MPVRRGYILSLSEHGKDDQAGISARSGESRYEVLNGHADIGADRDGCFWKKLTAGIVADNYRLGVWLAVISAFGFSFKAILIKIAYALPQQVPVDAVTLLSLRMLIALPLFLLLYRSSGAGAPKLIV